MTNQETRRELFELAQRHCRIRQRGASSCLHVCRECERAAIARYTDERRDIYREIYRTGLNR